MLPGKRSEVNEEKIIETEPYLVVKDKSYRNIRKRWNDCFSLEGNYANVVVSLVMRKHFSRSVIVMWSLM